MKVSRLMLTIALAAPAVAWSQSKDARATSASHLETMQVNVGRISPSLEHDRWSENVILWETRLDHRGKLDPTVLANMHHSLDRIAAIVAQLVGPEEKERWEANRDMWTAYLDAGGAPSRETLATMRETWMTMNANVARITAPGEKERWTANVELWKGVIGVK